MLNFCEQVIYFKIYSSNIVYKLIILSYDAIIYVYNYLISIYLIHSKIIFL